ncbi:hypothetical protein N7532_009991 [Penicillium argentinense]|uniref:Steroid 5-alpha reductase C-terminal domain-containing protein n=1 Tax=Penicillium argentinense TaxID=1131581 RepID=A0A9W9ENX4_9EURO|nr:uncharacterized protein N7532_009991 [Penicillium argentinense]KAJ5085220.1 hypothetical protein N7532_009991 [Penicillium argentinense]
MTSGMVGHPSTSAIDHGLSGSLGPRLQAIQPSFKMNPGDLGILKSTLLPSIGIYSCFSLATFIAAERTRRVELKDWLWPSGQVATAWWAAIGRPMYEKGVSFLDAWTGLSWTQKLLLGCVTAWGARLFARIASRSLKRGGDDPRYEASKKEPGFWKSALFNMFLPEAAVLSVISLPFTVPFTTSGTTLSLTTTTLDTVRAAGAALFGIGFGMEVLADTQLELHRRERSDLCRHGVWGLVRHPNYLGDTLVHISFAVLNIADSFNPIVLLGPLANYAFLRYVGGDKQTEASQEERYQADDPKKFGQLKMWRKEQNSFWPSLRDLTKPWAFAVAGCGLIAVVVEEGLQTTFDMQ